METLSQAVTSQKKAAPRKRRQLKFQQEQQQSARGWREDTRSGASASATHARCKNMEVPLETNPGKR